MTPTPIKSLNKHVLIYKDTSNNTNQIGFFARDTFDFLILAKEFKSHLKNNKGAMVQIQKKF